MDNKHQYTAPGPYPTIRCNGPNPRYAQLLTIDFASSKGELTAITEYVYQSWMLVPENASAARAMQSVAMVEMHHLDMLGTLIAMLGGNPKYRSVSSQNIRTVWTGSMPPYCRTVRDAMKNNIRAEEEAIATYERHASVIRDPAVVAVLNRIIQDEKVRIKVFRSYLEQA